MRNKRQAIKWTNSDPIHWCIYAASGGDESSLFDQQSAWGQPYDNPNMPQNKYNLHRKPMIHNSSSQSRSQGETTISHPHHQWYSQQSFYPRGNKYENTSAYSLIPVTCTMISIVWPQNKTISIKTQSYTIAVHSHNHMSIKSFQTL